MKFKLSSLFVTVFISIFSFCNAQESIQDKPTSNWPYLFPDFQNAKIIYKTGEISSSTINYHLLNEELQFIKNDMVFVAENLDEIDRVVCNNGFIFIYVDNKFYQLLGEGNIKLGKSYKGNINDLYETEGAYGTSTASSSVKKENSIYIGGMPGVNFKNLENDKQGGDIFSINTKRVFIKNGKVVNATKKNLYSLMPEEKKKINNLIKESKLKFNKDEDVIKLIEKL